MSVKESVTQGLPFSMLFLENQEINGSTLSTNPSVWSWTWILCYLLMDTLFLG